MYNISQTLTRGWEFDDPPTLTSFEFEKIDFHYWDALVNKYWHWCFYIGVFYLIIIHSLQRYMRNRKPLDLTVPLFLWNLCLGIFSLVGFTRVTPALVYVLLKENGFYTSVCVRKGLNVANILWGILFMASKVWELGDTVFILLRKRPLIFLHWYHHLVTLIVACSIGPLSEPIIRWYAAANYFVHSFMYPYFAVKVIGVQVPGYITRLITFMQFVQMILGLFVNLASLYFIKMGYECARFAVSINTFGILYASFGILFGKLLYQSFSKSKQVKNEIHIKHE